MSSVESKSDATPGEPSFDDLLDSVVADPSKISQLTEDQVTELRKRISPYGRTIDGDKKLCCLSVINMKEEWIKRIQMTSLIAFLYRGCDEHLAFESEPIQYLDDLDDSQKKIMLEKVYRDAVPARRQLAAEHIEDNRIKSCEMKEYQEANADQIESVSVEHQMLQTMIDNNVSLSSNQQKTYDDYEEWEINAVDKNAAKLREATMRTLEKIILRAENLTKRMIIREFLDGLFTFNPDKHIRGAYGFNPLDPSRTEVKTKVAKKSVRNWKKRDQIDSRRQKTGKHQTTMSSSSKNTEEKKEAPVEIVAPDTDEFNGTETPVQRSAVLHIPPAETFLKWNTFTDDHYEQIRSVAHDLYHEQPDIEFAINPFGVYSTNEEAKKFVEKHKDEVIWNIETLNTNNWNLIGAFAKNRERTDFLNNNTSVITELLNQVENDKKLGRQLMMSKAQKKKLANVGLEGPDSKAFRRYKTNFASTSDAAGAVDLSDYKLQKATYAKYQADQAFERERLAGLTRNANGDITLGTTDLSIRSGIDPNAPAKVSTYPDNDLDEACPDDAIQVDIITMTQGGLNVEKSNFFSKAADPPPNPGGKK
jgi:hypothetical protein